MKSCLLFLLIIVSSECARILVVSYFPSKSQTISEAALAKILAGRGHNVTMVSSIGVDEQSDNYKKVVLQEVDERAKEELKSGFDFNVHPYIQSYIYSTVFIPLLNITLSNPRFRKILDTETFDLVIVEQFYSDGLAYIAEYLDTPLIVYSTIDSSSWTNSLIGNSAPSSYVPDMLFSYTGEMTFLQRLDNSIMFLLNEYIRNFIILPAHNEIIQQNFPNAPSISAYQHKASLVFLNGHPSINQAVPKVPGMIDIGGFHIGTPKPLPEDLANILDSAEDGVILFSMGCVLDTAHMPHDTINIFFDAFAKLNQTILWKWGGVSRDMPKNVVIRDWFPQNDVLAHKNLKLFITHGGSHSLQEAVHYGVPCLIIPVFGDQYGNSRRATKSGYALNIDFDALTNDNLLPALNDLLHDPKFTEAARNTSNLTRDRITSPADTVAFWVDYVIRHKGAPHLRVASLQLHWYQYFLVDVILFVLVSLILFMIGMKFFINKFLRIFTFKMNCKEKLQ